MPVSDLTFPTSGGDFSELVVTPNTDGSYSVSAEGGGTIEEQSITLVSTNQEGVQATFSSDKGRVLKDSSVVGTEYGDTLIITGKSKSSDVRTRQGDDKVKSDEIIKESDYSTGKGDDTFVAKGSERFVAEDSSFRLGAGDDTANFKGNVRNIEVDLGKGEDVLIFGGNIRDVTIKLGSDGQADRIEIDPNANINGLKIVGADANDTLIIGSSQYSYDPNTKEWIDSNGNAFDF